MSLLRPLTAEQPASATEEVVVGALMLPSMHPHSDDAASQFSVYSAASSAAGAARAKPRLQKPVPLCLRRGVDNAKFVLECFHKDAAWFNAPGKWGFVALPADDATASSTPHLALVLCTSTRHREAWRITFDEASTQWTYRRPTPAEREWLLVQGFTAKPAADDDDSDADSEADSEADSDDDDYFGSSDDDADDAASSTAYQALRELVYDLHSFVDEVYGETLGDQWEPQLNMDQLEWVQVGPTRSSADLSAKNEKQFNALQGVKAAGTARISAPSVQLNADHTFVYDLALPHKPRAALALTYLSASDACVDPSEASQQVWCALFHKSGVVQYSYDLRALVLACTRAT